MLDAEIREALDALEKLVRRADEAVANAPSWAKKRTQRQRNSINAAANAMHRASRI